MFGEKTKTAPKTQRSPFHQEIWYQTGSLISIANRAEAASIKSGEPTITNAGEVVMARELLTAHEELLKLLDTALNRGSSIDEIQTQVFEPIMESSVVGDVAWLMVQNVIAQARKPRKALAGF